MSALRTTLLSKPVKSAKPAKPVLSRRYHMHSGGVFYIVVTVLLGIGSINSQNNLLFIVFGIALGAMLVSGVVSGAMMMGLEVERRPISPAQVGSNARFSYRLRNKLKRVPAMAIDLIEADRLRRKLSRRARAKPQVEAFIDVAPPKSVVDLSAVLPCRERGIIRLDPITISTTFPFGIVLKSVTVTAPDELLVLPRVVDLPPSLLLSKCVPEPSSNCQSSTALACKEPPVRARRSEMPRFRANAPDISGSNPAPGGCWSRT